MTFQPARITIGGTIDSDIYDELADRISRLHSPPQTELSGDMKNPNGYIHLRHKSRQNGRFPDLEGFCEDQSIPYNRKAQPVGPTHQGEFRLYRPGQGVVVQTYTVKPSSEPTGLFTRDELDEMVDQASSLSDFQTILQQESGETMKDLPPLQIPSGSIEPTR